MERSADNRIRTTEWEDVQYKYGNRVGKYSTHELEILAQKLSDQTEDTCLEAYDPNREKVEEKLRRGGYERADSGDDESDDDGKTEKKQSVEEVADSDDEDAALAAIRAKRLQELMKAKQNERFGVLREVAGSNYVSEVTDSSANNWVVAILVKPGNNDCEMLLNVFRTVAQRNKTIKFVSMISVDAIKNFPDKHLPCVLLYKDKELKKQLTTLAPWKDGPEFSINTVERVLKSAKVIAGEYSDDDNQ